MARICAEQTFNDRNANGLYTRTVALMRYGLVVDVFDGAWASDRDNDIEVVW
jgi:hypothetical protein